MRTRESRRVPYAFSARVAFARAPVAPVDLLVVFPSFDHRRSTTPEPPKVNAVLFIWQIGASTPVHFVITVRLSVHIHVVVYHVCPRPMDQYSPIIEPNSSYVNKLTVLKMNYYDIYYLCWSDLDISELGTSSDRKARVFWCPASHSSWPGLSWPSIPLRCAWPREMPGTSPAMTSGGTVQAHGNFSNGAIERIRFRRNRMRPVSDLPSPRAGLREEA